MDEQLEVLYFPNGRVGSVASVDDVSTELENDEESMTPDDDIIDDHFDANQDLSEETSEVAYAALTPEDWPHESVDDRDSENYLLFRYIEDLRFE